ncbi:acyl-CoA synthetase long-chain isoform X2 [Arctopsyche grandis]|uniref:acyl-CoA synthetase long-chain isoform X2 n=1 Tax=Arctopsyche grandis TaxID=121162 RepID=UPI00406D6F90
MYISSLTESLWVSTAIGAIRAIVFVCDILTFPVHLVLQRPWQKRAMSRRVKARVVEADEKSVIVRSIAKPGPNHVWLLREDINTMDKMLRAVVFVHGQQRCLGTREIINEEDEIQPNGRVFKKYNMGDYKWKSFTEVEILAKHFGKGLRELGHKPRENIVIFAETRLEWMVAAHGCFKQSIPVVTIYATLGDEAIAHGVNETEVTTVITTHDLLPKFRNILAKTPKVHTIIYMEDQIKTTDTKGFKEGVRIISYKQVIENGSSSQVESVPPGPKDTAIIMYTSGSTGVPKGVVLSHANLLSTMASFADAVPIIPGDILMGFLPLAHVFELLAESLCLLAGVPIGYSTPLTMIDSSSKIKRGTKGDATILQPTCLTTVPLIMDRICKGITEKVSKGGEFQNAFFRWAYVYKEKWMKRGYDTPMLNKIVFSKVSSLMGGKLRLMVSGGAPLAPDTHTQIKICLCCDVISGYGLTETTSSATVMDSYDRSTGRVGAPNTTCDIKLVNWEEGHYRVTNKPYPQGEIIIGGDSVSEGYYKLPGKSSEDFTTDSGKRWFKTGDIGEIHPDGCIKIIDRKKDLVKLQAGEYVSLGKVEAELKTCPIVENICVYGDSTKHFTVALVVPNQKQLEELATKIGISAMRFEQLCESTAMEKAVVKELADHARKCKLEKFEVPTAVTLCSDVWSPDMGLVTAAFKLKRKDIQERYQGDINRMYAS